MSSSQPIRLSSMVQQCQLQIYQFQPISQQVVNHRKDRDEEIASDQAGGSQGGVPDSIVIEGRRVIGNEC